MSNRFRYDEIRDKIDTFTVINCEHRNWFWKLIGHTAVVWKCPATGQLFVLESTQMGKSGVTGVQLTPMGTWVKQYPGKVKIRIPIFKFVQNNIDHDYKRRKLAEQFIKKYLGTSYPDIKSWEGKKKLILSALDIEINGKDILTYKGGDKGVFCTMLVIMFYQHGGLLPPQIPAKECEPDDTREGGFIEELLVDCYWPDEMEIN